PPSADREGRGSPRGPWRCRVFAGAGRRRGLRADSARSSASRSRAAVRTRRTPRSAPRTLHDTASPREPPGSTPARALPTTPPPQSILGSSRLPASPPLFASREQPLCRPRSCPPAQRMRAFAIRNVGREKAKHSHPSLPLMARCPAASSAPGRASVLENLENHRERSARERWANGKCQERVTVLTIVHGGAGSRHPRGICERATIADSLALRQSRHACSLFVGLRRTA